jgi:uncharacterized protein (TIGR00369 family)
MSFSTAPLETSMPEAADPPPGFEYIERAPFVNFVGPVYQSIENPVGQVQLGLRIAKHHTNTLGLVHGGLIATVCDSAMARALVFTLKRRAVTLRMAIDYLDGVHLGNWMIAEGRLVSHDDEVGLTDCRILVDGRQRGSASGVFRLLRAG